MTPYACRPIKVLVPLPGTSIGHWVFPNGFTKFCFFFEKQNPKELQIKKSQKNTI